MHARSHDFSLYFNMMSHTSLLFIVTIVGRLSILQATTIKYYTFEEQQNILIREYTNCAKAISTAHYPSEDAAIMCPMDFDGVYCWPYTFPGTVATISCPDYINKFDPSENASRKCMPNGQWRWSHANNRTARGNYTRCYDAAERLAQLDEITQPNDQLQISDIVKEHLPHIQKLYTVGYSVSIVALVTAMFIMLSLKRLHCARNTMHMNLFLSFILRGAATLIHNHLLSTDQGRLLKSYIFNNQSQTEIMDPDREHWECKLLTTLWMYTRLSNCIWIFLEGVYLHMLIFLTTFSHSNSIRWFTLAGWGSPVLFVFPWTLIRIYYDDVECWVKYNKRSLRWIIEAPIVFLILVNCLFFVVLIRLLFTKLRASENSNRETLIYRYIKLARSTLVLIPLFGVHYIVFLFVEFLATSDNGYLEVTRFYFDTFCTSFQGLAVGILFCFANGEVRSELSKKWNRWKLAKDMQNLKVSAITLLTSHHRPSISSENGSTATDKRRGSSLHSFNCKPNNGCHDVAARAIQEEETFLIVPKTDNNHNPFTAAETRLCET